MRPQMRSCNNNINNISSISGAGIIKCFNFCVQATAHTWSRPKRLSGFLSFGAFFRSQVWQHFNPRGVTRNGYGCARVLPSWRLHLRGDTRFSDGNACFITILFLLRRFRNRFAFFFSNRAFELPPPFYPGLCTQGVRDSKAQCILFIGQKCNKRGRKKIEE